VIELPAGLAAWAPQLAVLRSDLALTLAPWVGRLALAIGPLAATQRLHSGEPDGYAGLSRRGSYERLVAAEWGIADVFPEEFVRRATAGEHLFLELARREPRGALRSIAIVSAGPAQLGTPRLAHIAALIVLARRATAAGAGFAWGVLEDREHRLNDRLDEAGIEQLLGARTARTADAGAIAAWLHALGREPTRDFWFVGADDDAANAAGVGASRIIVRDVLEPGVRALEVEIDRRGTPARLRLDLPTDEQGARLLRDPFAKGGAASRVASAPGAALDVRFAPSARRLLVRLDDGSFEAWPIPSSPRDQLGNPRRWAPPRNHAVLALGIGRRSVLAATATRDDTTALELHHRDNRAIRVMLPERVAAALAARFAAGEPLPMGTCALVRFRKHAPPDLILCVLGRLLIVSGFSRWQQPGTVVALPFHSARDSAGSLALATAFFPTSFAWAEQRDDGQVRVVEATSSGNRPIAIVGAHPDPDVRFGFSLPRSAGWGAVVVAWDAAHYSVAAPQLAPTTLRAVAPVVGVCVLDGAPALLTHPHPDRLALLIGSRRELLPAAAAPIAAVAVCASEPSVAWVTEAGELVVYSMRHRAVLFRRRPGACA
jgi:hypothetical protein